MAQPPQPDHPSGPLRVSEQAGRLLILGAILLGGMALSAYSDSVIMFLFTLFAAWSFWVFGPSEGGPTASLDNDIDLDYD
ncbi:MAG: hypothetical protein GYB68_19970 [Chloroflexi bacterium]|nr:hypothetical protein [Chloroflexota bacterium]